MKKLFLVCGSHIDPVWLWKKEEGVSVAVSTFRAAADFIEKYDSFVFSHNESMLYEWIEEYEPELFERIKAHVKSGRWKLMGGWYLQPDCNLPSGESIVRQISLGNSYFKEKFGIVPETAVNFDPFGHNIGLTQILKKSGYKNYLITRPWQALFPLKDRRFIWRGKDGSEIDCFRSDTYGVGRGHAAKKIKEYLQNNENEEISMFCWGAGNHGGLPTHKDVQELESFAKECETELIQTNPDEYFAQPYTHVELVEKSLNPCLVGCYTSCVEIKQGHRALENALYSVEKMCSAAALETGMEYPSEKLLEAEKALMFSEFHDILPGTAIKSGMADGLKEVGYGLKIVEDLKTKAMLALTKGYSKSVEEDYPLFVFNPHPYKLKTTVEMEFNISDVLSNRKRTHKEFYGLTVTDDGVEIPSQVLKEECNLNNDWRKKIAFDCELEPMTVKRFYAHPTKPVETVTCEPKGDIFFDNGVYGARISKQTGLMDVCGMVGAFEARVISDTVDPWGMNEKQTKERLGEEIGSFRLMTDEETKAFAARNGVTAVRIVEDGDVETVVDCCFKYGRSDLLLTYKLYKRRPYFDVNVKTYWNEKDKALKLVLPVGRGNLFVDGMFVSEEHEESGREFAAQKWLRVGGVSGKVALLNKGTYGYSYENGEIKATLLRSSGYAAHPLGDFPIVPEDRFTGRMEQGENNFSFRVVLGEEAEKSNKYAVEFNEEYVALNHYPAGVGKIPQSPFEILGDGVSMSAFKRANDGDGYIVRLHNNSEKTVKIKLALKSGVSREISFGKYEIKTYRLRENELVECGILE